MTKIERAVITFLLAVMCLWARPAAAQVTFTLTFNDPNASYSSYYNALSSDALAAGASWARYLQGCGTINLQVNFADIPTAEGSSATSVLVGTDGPYFVYEQGAVAKIDGHSTSAVNAPDGYITIGTDYLTQDLWFDPDPTTRTAPVPTDKVDAVSVFEHEIGHVLAFNGFRDPISGTLAANYESTFDQDVLSDGGYLYFAGGHAMSVYGGPVPLTGGDYRHVGNYAPGPGSDLNSDLMNGIGLDFGRRYSISLLDLAISSDAGVPIRSATMPAAAVPEPAPVALLACGAIMLAAAVAVRRKGNENSPGGRSGLAPGRPEGAAERA